MAFYRFVVVAACVVSLVALRKRNLRRLHAHILRSKHRDKDLGDRFGMDVGGTLGKLVYFEKDGLQELVDVHNFLLSTTHYGGSAIREKRLQLRVNGGTIHLLRFETNHLQKVVEFVLHRCFHREIRTIASTGGGAFKFSKLFEEELGITLRKCDELECLIRVRILNIASYFRSLNNISQYL